MQTIHSRKTKCIWTLYPTQRISKGNVVEQKMNEVEEDLEHLLS